ncbi:TPA: hypothetical protein HA243_06460 [Candidatus Micrarchaeota archaeon]|nr:hypothetical protein [Candidatus Micrarchaeota archaeon]
MFLFQYKTVESKGGIQTLDQVLNEFFQLVKKLEYADLAALEKTSFNLGKFIQQRLPKRGMEGAKLSDQKINELLFSSVACSWLANRYVKLNLPDVPEIAGKIKVLKETVKKIDDAIPKNDQTNDYRFYFETFFQVLSSGVVKREGESPFLMLDFITARSLTTQIFNAQKGVFGQLPESSVYSGNKELLELFTSHVLKYLPIEVKSTWVQEASKEKPIQVYKEWKETGSRLYFSFIAKQPSNADIDLPPTGKDNAFFSGSQSKLEKEIGNFQLCLITSGNEERAVTPPSQDTREDLMKFAQNLKENVNPSPDAIISWSIKRLEGLFYAQKYDPRNKESIQKVKEVLQDIFNDLKTYYPGKSDQETWETLVKYLEVTASANVEVVFSGKNYNEYRNIAVSNWGTAQGRGEMVMEALKELMGSAEAPNIEIRKTLYLYQDISPELKEKLLADEKVPQGMKDWLSHTGVYDDLTGYQFGSGKEGLKRYMDYIKVNAPSVFRILTVGKKPAIVEKNGNYEVSNANEFNFAISTKGGLRDLEDPTKRMPSRSDVPESERKQVVSAINIGRGLILSSKNAMTMYLMMDSEPKSLQLGKELEINFDAFEKIESKNELGEVIGEKKPKTLDDLSVVIIDQDGIEIAVTSKRNSDNTFTVKFVPNKPGEYRLSAVGREGKFTTEKVGQIIKVGKAPEPIVETTPVAPVFAPEFSVQSPDLAPKGEVERKLVKLADISWTSTIRNVYEGPALPELGDKGFLSRFQEIISDANMKLLANDMAGANAVLKQLYDPTNPTNPNTWFGILTTSSARYNGWKNSIIDGDLEGFLARLQNVNDPDMWASAWSMILPTSPLYNSSVKTETISIRNLNPATSTQILSYAVQYCGVTLDWHPVKNEDFMLVNRWYGRLVNGELKVRNILPFEETSTIGMKGNELGTELLAFHSPSGIFAGFGANYRRNAFSLKFPYGEMDIGTESSMRLFGEIGKQVAISNAIVADLRVQQWFEKTRMLYAEGDEEGRWLPPGTKFEANISFNKGGTFNPNINVRLVRDKGGETEVLNSGRFRLGADFKIANFMGGELHTMPYWGLNLGPVKPVHEIGLQINLLNLDEIFGSPGIRMEGGKISR